MKNDEKLTYEGFTPQQLKELFRQLGYITSERSIYHWIAGTRKPSENARRLLAHIKKHITPKGDTK